MEPVGKRKPEEHPLPMPPVAADDRTPMQELLYAVSHDLQSPLRHIQSYLRLLESAPLGEDDRRHLDGARDNAQHLQRMLDAVLAMSRLETTPFRPEEVDLGDLAKRAQERLHDHPRAGVTTIDADPLPRVRGDEGRIRLLLDALLRNALDHGARNVRVHGARTDGGATLTVADDGPGFHARFAERVQRLFQTLQADRSHVGAGLAVARRVAEQHGGGLRIEAEEGGGVTVTVELRDTDGPA